MPPFSHTLGQRRYVFDGLASLLAKASPPKSGDQLAGIAAASDEERVAARLALADVPLKNFLEEPLIPYEEDEVTRLILDQHDRAAFEHIGAFTVGELRNWLLSYAADGAALAGVAPGLTPEMAAAVAKLMRNQDLILVAKKCSVVVRFRDTLGLPDRLAIRLQPNHPADDARGIAASILDGLLYGAGDAVIGITLKLLEEARAAALSLERGTLGDNVMYFETGQGSALSANAHHGVDQQTCEARAYAVARQFKPLLVNTVVGFIGPEYLYDGKQIIRAGLEDHFCGKLLGLPMGCDVCYTNHAEADQDDMDNLMTLLGVAGCNYFMGVPGADDIMLNYQSTSFHDALYVRQVLGLRPAPEFEAWLEKMGVMQGQRLQQIDDRHALVAAYLPAR